MIEPTVSCNVSNCPTCESPGKHLHPAVQHEGEVQICGDPWHTPMTPHALTREQEARKLADVWYSDEQMARFIRQDGPSSAEDLTAWATKHFRLAFIKGCQMSPALAQQAQELESAHELNRISAVALSEKEQEIERLNNDVGMLRDEPARLKQQLAAMRAERDEIAARWKHDFELRCDEEEKNEQLNKQLAASQQKVIELEERLVESEKAAYDVAGVIDYLKATLAAREAELEAALAEQRVLDSKYVDERAARFKAQDEADQYYKCLQIEKGEHATALAERDTARQDAARLREAAHNLTCEVCKLDMQKALKGEG